SLVRPSPPSLSVMRSDSTSWSDSRKSPRGTDTITTPHVGRGTRGRRVIIGAARRAFRRGVTPWRAGPVPLVTVMSAPMETAPRTYEIRTYGCQMNVHDSERLSGLLEAAGY